MVHAGAVQLSRIHGRPDDLDEPPDSVAFLGATVLAASRMADDAVISELNYFLRLREVLGVDVDAGGQTTRPVGLSTGAEEAFWQSWNRWLNRKGLLATADRGPEG
ncbi:hypothetical protein J0H33_16705, partial [bacterium]|nr:hypothetical protein [bacterium]